jgi:plastocyanin
MTRTHALLLAAAVVVVAAVATALALGEEQPDPVRARDGRVALTMTDFRFAPQRVRVPAGRLRIEVRNAGTLPHALRLERVNTGGEAGRVVTRKPGANGVLEVEQVNRGRYRYYCPLAHHDDLGMHGELIVR